MAEKIKTENGGGFLRHPLICAAGAALLLRGLFLLFYLASPFRYFHCVPGLDMETLLHFGEWGTPDNAFFFTLHRLQVFLFWKLNNASHPIVLHVLWQSILGGLGAVLLADIMLKISGRRNLALLAGVVWALNPVELMYEFTTLQDSLVNFGVILSFWSFLAARKHRFLPLYALAAGAAAGAAGTGRPVATGMTLFLVFGCFYYLKRKKLPLKGGLAYMAGVLSVWLIFSFVNLQGNKTFTCFFNPIPYAVSVNASPAPVWGQTSSAETNFFSQVAKTSLKMVCRIPKLWSPVETPENLNIYFLQSKIPFFRIPFEFIPLCAALAIFLFLLKGLWRKKEGLILIPVFTLAFFLCIREPIGRYRLLLLPWFCLLTVCLFDYCCKTKKRTLYLAAALLLGFVVYRTALWAPPLRAADFSAWGWALEKEAGKITPEVMAHFHTAFNLKPETNNAVALITRAIQTENRALAENSAKIWMESSGNSGISCYYAAVAAFPDYGKMQKFLDMVKKEELPGRLLARFYIMQGDVCRRFKDDKGALAAYKSAADTLECTPKLRNYAQQQIKKLEMKK